MYTTLVMQLNFNKSFKCISKANCIIKLWLYEDAAGRRKESAAFLNCVSIFTIRSGMGSC